MKKSRHFTWYCLSSSMGGCEKQRSNLGMFKSSMKMTMCLFLGAPSTFLRFFSSLASIISWVRVELVCAEKLRKMGKQSPLADTASSRSRAITDLPTPVSPVNSTDLLVGMILMGQWFQHNFTQVYHTLQLLNMNIV